MENKQIHNPTRSELITDFVKSNPEYYIKEFKKILVMNVFQEKKTELLLNLKCKNNDDCFNKLDEGSSDPDIFLKTDLKLEQKIDYYTGKLRPLTNDEKK